MPWKGKAGTSNLIIRFSLTFDEEKIWESSSSFGCTPVYEPANGNWYWWISPCSLSNCRRAYEDVTNMKLGTNKLNLKYYFSTLPKIAMAAFGDSVVTLISCTFLQSKLGHFRFETFYKRIVFIEIAIPTTIRFFVKKRKHLSSLRILHTWLCEA